MKATKNYFFSILAIMLLGVTFTHAQEAVQMGAVKDADGNAYNTLVIGKQTWMLENLRTTKYNDGTPVKNIKDGMEWIAAEEGAYASTNNTSDKAIIQKEGLLYNWYAVETGKLCPKGWYVPTEEEWNMLIAYASKTGTNVAKSLASKAGWIVNKAENAVGNDLSKNNASGFNAVATGYRKEPTGEFSLNGKITVFWSETERSSKNAASYILSNGGVTFDPRSNSKKSGFSVRCIKQ